MLTNDVVSFEQLGPEFQTFVHPDWFVSAGRKPGRRLFSCRSSVYVFGVFRPTYATPKVLEKAGLTMADIDVVELHEAFAVSRLCL